MPLEAPVNGLFYINQWVNSFSIGAAFCEPGLGYIFEVRAQNRFSHYCAVVFSSPSSVTPNISDSSLLQEHIWSHFRAGKASIVSACLFQGMVKIKRQLEEFSERLTAQEKELTAQRNERIALEEEFTVLEERFTAREERFTAREERFRTQEERFTAREENLVQLKEKLDLELDAMWERLKRPILEIEACLDSLKQQRLPSEQRCLELDVVLASVEQQCLESEEFSFRQQQEKRKKIDEASKAALEILEDTKPSRTEIISNRSSTEVGLKNIPVPAARSGVACFAQINAEQGNGIKIPTSKLRSAMLKVIGLAFLVVCNLLTLSGRANQLMQHACVLSSSLIISYLINAAVVNRLSSSQLQTN